ncbi:uncharacterized protein LOC132194351 [Neocloeon triangulifer]|uniref:uncharacterized protein LOC132194351 n=1 Tax=Neocloeon triangulifer TaxID=2078957 RepID=UPI00286EE82C|nr:uncharacterized protein LOC132194351 [Neocloeon triangulifer]XP_059471560.1 uncharacterized protein LOC132194351 [Neocloeon triangulifer]
MVRKSLTPFPKSEKIMGVKKENTPKSGLKSKALVETSPVSASPLSLKKKKKASMSGSFEVSEVADVKLPEIPETTTPVSGKKKRKALLNVQPESEESTPAKVKSEKKKKSLGLVKTAEIIKEEVVLSGKKSMKKKSIVPESAESTTEDGQKSLSAKKKKKLSLESTEQLQSPVSKALKKKGQESKVAEDSLDVSVQSPEKKKRKRKKSKGPAGEPGSAVKKPKVDGEESNVEEETGKSPKNEQTPKKKNENQKYTLFVGNLPYDVTEENIREHFGKHGINITRVKLPRDKQTQLIRGFAYVDIPDNDQYVRALKMDASFLSKRRIRVQFTLPGKKSQHGRMKVIVAKNLKLHAMKKKGILLA